MPGSWFDSNHPSALGYDASGNGSELAGPIDPNTGLPEGNPAGASPQAVDPRLGNGPVGLKVQGGYQQDMGAGTGDPSMGVAGPWGSSGDAPGMNTVPAGAGPGGPAWNAGMAAQGADTGLNASDPHGGFGVNANGLPPMWDQNFAYQDFTAPTSDSVANDPGNQYALAEAKKAQERGASAHGNLMTGGFQTSLARNQMGIAAGQYQNVYNRDLGTYNTNRSNALDAFNIARSVSDTGWANSFGVANAANQNDLAYAQLYGNNTMSGAGAQGAGLTGAANANAAGAVAGTNAWNSALSGIGNSAQQIALLNSMGYFKKAG